MFDRMVSIVSLVIGCGTIYFSLQMPKPIFSSQMGPNVFPQAVGVLIVLVSILLFLENWKNRKRTNEKKREQTEETENSEKKETIVLIAVGYILGYVLIFKLVGFIISSFLLIVLLGWQLGARRWIPLTVTAVLFPGAIYLIFTQLGIVLP